MADAARVICASEALVDGGKGVRFEVARGGRQYPAFAVRYQGQVYAYLNSCAHVAVEMDWMDGEFFDYSKLYLICATHGATYEPETGLCVQGPCAGARLTRVAVIESDGAVRLNEGTSHHV